MIFDIGGPFGWIRPVGGIAERKPEGKCGMQRYAVNSANHASTYAERRTEARAALASIREDRAALNFAFWTGRRYLRLMDKITLDPTWLYEPKSGLPDCYSPAVLPIPPVLAARCI
ncbi:MAG: hypothetical protein Q4G24_13390 [Paracoccus sp. (in: a-proteobacteria)]|uniref:hypothetical protein n=1 Tax=Paracoccus sp. TaxID=267 RepID=UPI0026DEEBE9|nr:hypothetical protein [Paracoccus sp. (in: a-proteobacteria)]MDO5622453.1 hypothetical protein [Paracoccus sp. (in: a-proteobacteria)]